MSTDWNVNTHFGDSDWRTLYHKFPNKKKKKKKSMQYDKEKHQ